MRMLRYALVMIAMGVLTSAPARAAVAQEDPAESARTWLGRAEQIEQFIRDAKVVAIEDIGTGVTNPKRAELAPGGPVLRIAFKPIRPGNYRGHFESYESEIAAYEFDKLLGLGMIPPTVQRRISGDVGAAVMWVSPVQSFKELSGAPSPPSTQIGRWNYQLIRAKMFHNIIYNKDPNLGNWLVDPAWNLILIDNSRAFTTENKMVHKLTRIDRDLWDRFTALDEVTLTAALGTWLREGEIRAILKRRDEMAEDIQQMVDERGEAAVFVHYRPLPTRSPERTQPGVEPSAHAEVDLQALGGQLLSALSDTPVVLAGSELTWLGQVVHLAAYDGPDADIARSAVDRGHTLGLVTQLDGLLSLRPDEHNPEHYEMLTDLLEKQAEVFGLIAEDDGLTIVQVTLCREAP